MVVIGAELEDGPLPITDSKVDSIKAVSVKVGQGQGVTPEHGATPQLAFWGQGALSSFNGEPGGRSLP